MQGSSPCDLPKRRPAVSWPATAPSPYTCNPQTTDLVSVMIFPVKFLGAWGKMRKKNFTMTGSRDLPLLAKCNLGGENTEGIMGGECRMHGMVEKLLIILCMGT